MAELHLAENLVTLRKERKITQDTLADFIGVSKASVSKWETGQSFPDIETLPKLASYFNRSIDELMGYEAQLDRKRIAKVYFQLAESFAKKPFKEAYAETVEWIKEYYSCYPFLHQMAVLLLNHSMLAKSEKRQNEVLEQVIHLCQRICEYSDDVSLCKDTLALEAMAYIALRKPEKVFDLLGENIRPYTGNDELIAQAYQMMGNTEKAVEVMQVNMYQKLLSIFQTGTGFLSASAADYEKTKEIIRRLQALIDTFDLVNLHPHSTTGFYYQAAVILCMQNDYDGAMELLEQYAASAKTLCENLNLHGDDFFDQIGQWLSEFVLGTKAVREKSVVVQSIQQMFMDVNFAPLAERKEYQRLKKEIERL